jgi:hypothetical protein
VLDRLAEPEAAAVATLPAGMLTIGAFADGSSAVEARGGAIPHTSQ